MIGATVVNMDTAYGTTPWGRQQEVHHTAGPVYVDTDEERRASIASGTEVSVKQSQGASERAASDSITTMVNYIGVTDIETEGGKDALSSFHAALAKIFGRQPEDA